MTIGATQTRREQDREVEEVVLLFRELDNCVWGILNHTSCKECESIHTWEMAKNMKHYMFGLLGREKYKTERIKYDF